MAKKDCFALHPNVNKEALNDRVELLREKNPNLSDEKGYIEAAKQALEEYQSGLNEIEQEIIKHYRDSHIPTKEETKPIKPIEPIEETEAPVEKDATPSRYKDVRFKDFLANAEVTIEGKPENAASTLNKLRKKIETLNAFLKCMEG